MSSSTDPPGTAALKDYLLVSSVVDRLCILNQKKTQIGGHDQQRVMRREEVALESALRAAGYTDWTAWPGCQQLREVHSQLWRLENEVRVAERRRDFGEHFVNMLREIRVSNHRRHELRDGLSGPAGPADPLEMIEVPSGMEGFLDRLAIRVATSGTPEDEVDRKFIPWTQQLADGGLPRAFDLDVFQRLLAIHRRMTAAWAEVDAWHRDRGEPSVVIQSGRAIYLLNDARTACRMNIVTRFPSEFWDIKQYEPYPVPLEWSDVDLTWRSGPLS